MNRKLNNKGFTLIELLAVLVILVAIMSIAIPTISSSLERTKAKQDESRKKLIEAAAELYVTDHKNEVYNILNRESTDNCWIGFDKVKSYLTEDEISLIEENMEATYPGILFRTTPHSYEYMNNKPSYYWSPDC